MPEERLNRMDCHLGDASRAIISVIGFDCTKQGCRTLGEETRPGLDLFGYVASRCIAV